MKLLDCYLPVFKLVAQLTHQPSLFSDYDTFRAICLSRLEEAVQEAEYHDISNFEREEAFFSVVVWLDETVLCSGQPFAQSWRYDLLQRKYFQTSIGGEMFFDRLSHLKEEHQKVRRVFLYCLQNGFNGKYSALQDRSALALLVEEQRQLCLPQAWQVWPNEAPLTPVSVRKRVFSSSKSHIVLALLGIVLIYTTLALLQTLYYL
jgi:type VI secretion system protein ImpK